MRVNVNTADEQYMRLALRLAERGRGRVEPNPMVGAVIVRNGRIIGRGWHKQFGGPHAEVNAVANARGSVRGATMYVTLEPCAHFGKTPPCTDLIIRHKLRRVVVACRDIFPPTAGKGIRKLRAAGIRVDEGLLRREASDLNAPFFKLVASGRPWIIAKWAMTLDGKIASRTGDSKWISSPEARTFVHKMRDLADGIIVGIGTALADDPRLTCRIDGGRSPKRIVLDAMARLPLTSRLVRTAKKIPVLVAVSNRAPKARIRRLLDAGCEVIVLSGPRGHINLGKLLDHLGSLRMTNVIVEGGAEVLGAFFDAGLVDEVLAFVSPKIIGGGKPAVLGRGIAAMSDALPLASPALQQFGDTWLIRGRLAR